MSPTARLKAARMTRAAIQTLDGSMIAACSAQQCFTIVYLFNASGCSYASKSVQQPSKLTMRVFFTKRWECCTAVLGQAHERQQRGASRCL